MLGEFGMKRKVLLSSVIICIVMLASFCFAVGSTSSTIKFTLEQFKMKVGSTQGLAAVISGAGVDYSKITSSNESVLKIINGNTLKAVSSGISTLTYPMVDKDGKDVSLYCYVEVTRDYNTYDFVNATNSQKIIISLTIDGITTEIESAKAAIPTFPKMGKQGYVFDGWYYEETYETKVKSDQRFNKDTTLYGRWITEEEANAKLPKATPMYEDVVDHWARNAIESVSYIGLFKGINETQFGPDVPMTRAMTIAVIGRLEEDLGEHKLDVKDVADSAYYASALAWAIDNKIVTDLDNGNFRPNDEIKREEVAIYMANYIKYKAYKTESKVVILPSFSDASSMSKEGKEAVDMLYSMNIMQGNPDNTFSPKASLTRAQIAQIFFNFNNFKMKYKG